MVDSRRRHVRADPLASGGDAGGHLIFHGGGWASYLGYDETQDRPTIDRALLRRVAHQARPYLWLLVIVMATIVVTTFVSLVPPLLMRNLIDVAIPEANLTRVTLLGATMVAIPLVNGVIGVLQRWASARAGEGIIFDLRTAVYSHLQRMSFGFFTATRPGELMSRLNSDVVGAQSAVTGTLISVASNSFMTVATLVVMLRLEWRLTLASVAVLPLFVLPGRRVGKVLRRLTRQQMQSNARMNSAMNETLNLSGALLVKLFGRSDDEDRRFARHAADVRDLGVRRALIGRWFLLALSAVSAVGSALVFWLGAVLVVHGSLTIGTIVALSAFLAQLYGPLSALANARVELATSLVSFERVFEVLDLPRDIDESSDALDLPDVAGRVTFEDVSFDYRSAAPVGLASVERLSWRGFTQEEEGPRIVLAPHPGRPRALDHLDFDVAPGELVALVGPSGAGKTTVTYLIPRLYDATEGRVLIDGHDVRTLTTAALSRAVGVVTQETYLIHDTIATNLRYARADASSADLEAACRAANIHDFIAELPDGYDTLVGERGYRLSGGEKQRVAIARVILKDPRILVLDEATSHLDARSEALIQEALERVMAGRTSFVIAHRLSTVLAADRILVLDEGHVVEQGTHRQLVAAGGLYARLYETQFAAASD